MKMLKTKHFRRIVVFLAMIAPAVYLFGSLFSALAGAHGQEVFAEPIYENVFVEVEGFQGVGTYKYVVESTDFDSYIAGVRSTSTYVSMPTVVFNNQEYSSYYRYSDSYASGYFTLRYTTSSDPRTAIASRSNSVWSPSVPFPWEFYLEDAYYSPLVVDGVGKLYMLSYGPVGDPVTNSGAYSDYVFKNFFAKDNFLEQIGKDVLSETPHGFVPFASFWKYLDENMLHMGDMQLGLMGYGYVYYACHVLLFDIAFILVTFFLDFIQKVNDKVVGGVD